MKLFIPNMGEPFTISKGWEFPLYAERRNEKAAKAMGLFSDIRHVQFKDALGMDKWEERWVLQDVNYKILKDFGPTHKAYLPADTILSVDRYYFNKQAPEYNSVTFWAKLPDMKRKIRFWAKIADVNNIEI